MSYAESIAGHSAKNETMRLGLFLVHDEDGLKGLVTEPPLPQSTFRPAQNRD